ncbi:MarR family winged helix-turn-helix transcriptional regulator [Paenibacillus physcomitrellae]|uniref:MarR family winged helix-turn-helix transcriptional regulator n=1 Tax=Paenibacillus physcomitrellae TaxID=1619311 RepID=UPI002467C9E8|nr:MarR family transcriptional regulator [Paenibacillus physcomitrellae]
MHERLKIRPASLTNLLNTLVMGGWILRKPDQQDARTNRVFLTEQGKAQCKVCTEIITELEQTVRQGLSPEEVALLLVWMKKNSAKFIAPISKCRRFHFEFLFRKAKYIYSKPIHRRKNQWCNIIYAQLSL